MICHFKMKYRILENNTGLTNTYISRILIDRGPDHAYLRFGSSIKFISGEEVKKMNFGKKYYTKKDKSGMYKNSVFYQYYQRLGTIDALASVLNISRQRVHQLLTLHVKKETEDKYLSILDKSLDNSL